MSGRLEAIWNKRAHRGPMDPRVTGTLIEGEGLAGSVGRSRRRQVTIISAEAWAKATDAIGTEVEPSARRANLMVSGIELEGTRGRVLRVGSTRLEIGGETTPCERMEEAADGLQEALTPNWRAGAFAQVISGGEIRVGDAVSWES
jgi:MOSC domain-containing protein YiiM